MDQLELFRTIAREPHVYARQWRQDTGRPVVGMNCSSVPEELIWAFGALPYRLIGKTPAAAGADRHLQVSCCSVVRRALEDSLTNELDFLDGMVFASACDAMSRLSDIWRLNRLTPFHLDMLLPARLTGQPSRRYLPRVVAKLKSDLEHHLLMTLSSQALSRTLATQNSIRQSLSLLDDLRMSGAVQVSGADMQAITLAAMVMDRDQAARQLKTLLHDLEPSAKPATRRIIISGSLLTSSELLDCVEESGAETAAFDLCTGMRHFAGLVDESLDPVSGLAERCALRPVCPARHGGLTTRTEHMKGLLRETGAAGVIFALTKFCDPHAFDIPLLSQTLAEAGVPSLVLETDESQTLSEQMRTRCQAFVEMLSL